jgi:quercetin dioxygenase-like cupin family protein
MEDHTMKPMLLTLFMMIGVGVFALAEGRDRADVVGADGKLLNLSTVELAPGAVNALESLSAEVVYVLEGAGALNVDGKPAVALKVGTVVQLAPKHNHVFTNTSLTRTLKILVVQLVETGQARVVLATSGTRHQKQGGQECQQLPNGDLSQQKNKEQEGSIMKGLVF